MTPFQKTPAWRSTPPALFPPVMGLFGLALAWRRASAFSDAAGTISDLVFGVVTMLFLLLAAAYVAKVISAPEVVGRDLTVLPGRLGLSAFSMSVMLLGAGLVPFSTGLATVLVFGGLALHAALAVWIARLLLAAPPEGRAVTPAWHLSFVGFIVAPLAAAPLGYEGLAQLVLYATVPVAAVIYGLSLRQFLTRRAPEPLRPLLAIHLAPLALFGTAAALTGQGALALGFATAASGLILLLLASARWLTTVGFSPLWGAFTFPLAAYAGLCLTLAPAYEAFRWPGFAALIAASLLIPWIAAKVVRMWLRGSLAPKTNAAVA